MGQGNENTELVSIIIVNHNGKHFLKNCLESVLAQEYTPFEVILLDNGSEDGSVAFVQNTYPTVRIVEAGGNLGFAQANNRATECSRGELVVLLNNDTTVKRGWLRGLVDAVTPEVVAVASSLVITQGIPDRFYEKNGSINFLGHNIMRKFEKPENIFFASGASLVFKKRLLGRPFDDEYFAYCEDVYLSMRSRFKGYAVLQARESVVSHYGSGTTKKLARSRRTMLQERNRLLNTLLFFSLKTILKVIPLILVNGFAKLGVSIFSEKYSPVGLLQAYWWLWANIPHLIRKRRALHEEFVVDEADVISWMTSDVADGEQIWGRPVNLLCRWYCRMVGLRTLESLPRGAR